MHLAPDTQAGTCSICCCLDVARLSSCMGVSRRYVASLGSLPLNHHSACAQGAKLTVRRGYQSCSGARYKCVSGELTGLSTNAAAPDADHDGPHILDRFFARCNIVALVLERRGAMRTAAKVYMPCTAQRFRTRAHLLIDSSYVYIVIRM